MWNSLVFSVRNLDLLNYLRLLQYTAADDSGTVESWFYTTMYVYVCFCP